MNVQKLEENNIKVGDSVFFQYQVTKYSKNIGFYNSLRTSRKKHYVVKIEEKYITLCMNPNLKGRKESYYLPYIHDLWKAH